MTRPFIRTLDGMENENGSTKGLATAAQLWRLNSIGLVDLRDEAGEPLQRTVIKEVLGQAAHAGLCHPVRGVREGA
jgi:hypothetical protein